MGKRKEDPKEPGAPVWMATYADLMSLLLCFFVMIFSMSIITEIRWEAFVLTQQRRMGYEGTSRIPSPDRLPSTALSTTSEMSRRTAALSGGQPTPGRGGMSPDLQTIHPDGDIVRGGLIRFDLGSDQLNEQAIQGLGAMFPLLLASPNRIMVKGFAAPSEAEIGGYSRDFYLAFARAIVVKDHLISLGLREEFFQISVSDSSTIPHRAILPPRTDPRLAGASAAVFIINQTPRHTNETPRE